MFGNESIFCILITEGNEGNGTKRILFTMGLKCIFQRVRKKKTKAVAAPAVDADAAAYRQL
jgi:hypothetical protein